MDGLNGGSFSSGSMRYEIEQGRRYSSDNCPYVYNETQHIFKAFTFGEGDEKKYNKVIEKFDDHFIPKKNVIHERACFHRRVQKEGETAEAFIRNLYELAEHCEFGTQRDERIRERIVIGILDK